MYSMKSALWSMFRQVGIEKQVSQKMACLVWDNVVGPEIRANTYPHYVKSGILFVMVKSSSWANQLTFLKRDLVKKINENLEGKIIKDIRFQVGFIKRNRPDINRKQIEKIQLCELDESEKKKVTEISKRVKDKELRYRLRELLSKDMRYRKTKARKGFKKCKICSVYIDEVDDMCYICKQTAGSIRIDQLKAVLEEAPWLSNDELDKLLPGSVGEYEIARSRLIRETESRLDDAIIEYMSNPTSDNSTKMKTFAYQLTFLVFQVKPDRLDSVTICNAIGKDRQKIVFGGY